MTASDESILQEMPGATSRHSGASAQRPKGSGYRTVTADSAASALRALASEHFTVILCDIRMPGMDGFQMLARLRAHGLACETAVLFLSAANLDRDSERKAYELGAVGFIPKPFDPDLLRSQVRALVGLCQNARPAPAGDGVPSTERAAALAVAEEAERLLRSKDTFVAVLGHDLRSPLGTVDLGCRILSTEPHLTESGRATLARIRRAVDRMSKMVTDIVDFARTAGGTSFPIRARPTDLASVLSAVVDELRSTHPGRPIELSLSEHLAGVCDPERIGQAVGNMVLNAVEHGSGPVLVSGRLREEELELEVRNGGEPIAEERIRTLFDPFSHGPKGSRGLGLGLYIVHEIARGHGGTVEVESTRASGTTFTMRWPRRLSGGAEAERPLGDVATDTGLRQVS